MANLKILRISELPELPDIFNGMRTVVALDRENYLIDVNKIKGKKIVDVSAIQSKESEKPNTITLTFSDGSKYNITVYNGHDGGEGIVGGEGEKGNQGEDAIINYYRQDQYGNGITDVLYIVNNSITEDPTLPWSAYRGIDLNEKIYDLNETFLTEEEYERLFIDVKYLYAEFTTKVDDQTSIIFNTDVNDHKVYKKYWTYEDTGLETFYIYNPVSNTYDAISADLWADVYLGAQSGYFLITSSMEKDDTELFYYDKSDFTYKPVIKVESHIGNELDDDGKEIKDDDGKPIPIYKYIGNKEIKNYYLDEVNAFIDATYDMQSKKWVFNLVTGPKGEIIPTVYTSIDGVNFTKLTDEEVLNIDTTALVSYYTEPDPEKRIANIGDYLAEKTLRYYKLDDDKTYYEVEPSDISEDNFDEYMIVSKNTSSNVYTYERHYLKKVYGEDTYFVDVLEISKIDLYYYTDDRIYYTRSIVITPAIDAEHEATSEEVYTPVKIPAWIYAEFITNDEDVNALILNANEGLGQEDNTVIDDTAEDTDAHIETKEILRIVPGTKPDLYRKNSDLSFTLVNLNKDEIYSTFEYYILTDEYSYSEITGEYALSNGIVVLYTFDETTNTYEPHRDAIISENIYYLQTPVYKRIQNPEEFLSTEDLTLFYGEPKALPITIYPNNSLRSIVLIEYDPSRLVFFEDGRIAATVGNNFTTSVIIRSVENPDIYARVNVRLTTPVKSITLNDSNIYETNIGESVIIKYTVGPDNSENKNIIWVADDPEAVLIENGEEENTIKITGLKKNKKVVISGNAEDGFGTRASFNFEVIQVAEEVYWEQDNIIYHEDVYYESWEVIAHNADHPDDLISTDTVKEPAYYSLTALLFKDVLLNPIVKPDDTSYPQIDWESSDPSIASVVEKEIEVIDQEEVSHLATQADIDNNLAENIGDKVIDVQEIKHRENKYFLTSSKTGNVVITGRLSRYNDLMVEVKVRIDQSVEQINIYPDNLSINVNVSKKLVAEILPDNDEVQKAIEWISGNSDIVEVSPTGTITAKNPGNTTVVARALDGSDTEGISNIIVTIPAKDIILSGEDINGIIYVGVDKTTTITAEIIYNTNYTEGTKLGINWSVADEDIASIDESGVVTGLKIGNTTILANAQDGSGVFGTIKLQVIKLVESISFELTNVTMEIGDTLVLVPNVLPDDASNGVVIWQSSNENIAKVKQSGIVYAREEGECVITATTTDSTNLTATCNITVNKKSIE